MTPLHTLDALMATDPASAAEAIDAMSVETAESTLGALVERCASAVSGFDAARGPAVDVLTAILMKVRRQELLDQRAKTLSDACYYYKQIGRAFDAIPRGLAAKELANRFGLKNLERLAATGLGTAYMEAACFEEACITLERSLTLSKELDDALLVCLAMTNAGALLKEMGLYQDAIDVFDKALAHETSSQRGRYLGFINATNGLYSAHRLRNDEAAFRYLKIGSELYEENPLTDVVLKTNFEYNRALYLLFRRDNETAEVLIEAAKRRVSGIHNPRVEILLDVAEALCNWASRDPVRERLARKRLVELHHLSRQTRVHHDHVLRALIEVHGRTITGEVEALGRNEETGSSIDALKRIVSETAQIGMRYARELVDATVGVNSEKELVEYTTNVKHAKFYRQVSDREAAARAQNASFDPFTGVRRRLGDETTDAIEPTVSSLGANAGLVRKHDELTAIHADLAKLRVDSLKAAMRTAAYNVAENWALAAEFFDDQTGQHCFRVGRLAGLLAAELGMDREYCVRIEHAARLHDIGKIAVNEMILLKPGPLDSAEVTAMRAHTEVGAQLLEGSADETLQMAAAIAKYHHAWWNGDGYPRTAGDGIPLAARICAYADVYDALVTRRPYKRAWPHQLAVEQMLSESGAHFDPRMMRPFLRVLERHVGSSAQPPSTQQHLQEMEANGLLTSRRKLMGALGIEQSAPAARIDGERPSLR